MKDIKTIFISVVTYIVELIALYQLTWYSKTLPFTNISFDMILVLTVMWSTISIIIIFNILVLILHSTFVKNPTILEKEYENSKSFIAFVNKPIRQVLRFIDLIVGVLVFILAAEQGLIYLSILTASYVILANSLRSVGVSHYKKQIETYERSNQKS